MNLKDIILLAAGALLAVSDAVSATTTQNTPTVETPRVIKAKEAFADGNDGKRSLRSYKDTDSEAEERGLFGDSMFQKWDAYTVGHIREKLKMDPFNTRWASLLFEYLNVYKKAGGEVVRHTTNGKSVTISNKAQMRIYKNK